jgi:hypothetical protein
MDEKETPRVVVTLGNGKIHVVSSIDLLVLHVEDGSFVEMCRADPDQVDRDFVGWLAETNRLIEEG